MLGATEVDTVIWTWMQCQHIQKLCYCLPKKYRVLFLQGEERGDREWRSEGIAVVSFFCSSGRTFFCQLLVSSLHEHSLPLVQVEVDEEEEEEEEEPEEGDEGG